MATHLPRVKSLLNLKTLLNIFHKKLLPFGKIFLIDKLFENEKW